VIRGLARLSAGVNPYSSPAASLHTHRGAPSSHAVFPSAPTLPQPFHPPSDVTTTADWRPSMAARQRIRRKAAEHHGVDGADTERRRAIA